MLRNIFSQDSRNHLQPRTNSVRLNSAGFMACPAAVKQLMCPQQLALSNQLYQVAFEQAQQVIQPSILERDLLAVWN